LYQQREVEQLWVVVWVVVDLKVSPLLGPEVELFLCHAPVQAVRLDAEAALVEVLFRP